MYCAVHSKEDNYNCIGQMVIMEWSH